MPVVGNVCGHRYCRLEGEAAAVVKVTARVSETGQLIHADNETEWALVWRGLRHGKPLSLYCPERSCDNALTAAQRPASAPDGAKVTRFFRFKGSRSCAHSERADGIVVTVGGEQPVARGPAVLPVRAGETAEHSWLKEYVRRAAVRLGYPVVVEMTLTPQVRADLFVDGAQCRRVEVQRGPTDIAGRTALYPDVVWLLRMASSEPNTDALFDQRCVQVRISEWQSDRSSWGAAEPWNEADPWGRPVTVRATSTVLIPRDRPDDNKRYGFFTTDKKMSLDRFLDDVWSGRRRWYPRWEVHSFAGWATAADVKRYREWVARRKASETAAYETAAYETAASETAASETAASETAASEAARVAAGPEGAPLERDWLLGIARQEEVRQEEAGPTSVQPVLKADGVDAPAMQSSLGDPERLYRPPLNPTTRPAASPTRWRRMLRWFTR